MRTLLPSFVRGEQLLTSLWNSSYAQSEPWRIPEDEGTVTLLER
jgi:hypothetical protein